MTEDVFGRFVCSGEADTNALAAGREELVICGNRVGEIEEGGGRFMRLPG